jgi:protein gp37
MGHLKTGGGIIVAERTGITWTNHTFNIVWGCEEVSPACDNCYARTLAKRFGFDVWGPDTPRRTFDVEHWNEPLKWNRQAARDSRNALVFCSSMCDVFEDHPTVIAELAKLWPLIRVTPNLTWQLLTKRPHRIVRSLPDDWGDGYSNVWLGTTIESNEFAPRAKMLVAAPAKCHFVSYEPACGPLDAMPLHHIEWVIFGGESGRGFRQHNPQWARDMMNRCRQEGVAYFYKQGSSLKAGADSLLDGVECKEFPIGYNYVPVPEKVRKGKSGSLSLPMV